MTLGRIHSSTDEKKCNSEVGDLHKGSPYYARSGENDALLTRVGDN
jgi:hypothetical protein